MEDAFGGRYAMGPRVPMIRRDEPQAWTATLLKAPARAILGRSTTTAACVEAHLCEKPVAATSMTIPIALGVCIPIVAAIGCLLFFHRRNIKRQRQEDLHDPHKSLDFGLGDGGAKNSRKSLIGKEKEGGGRFNRQQMSMDMNLSNPYLLPPEVQQSRESLNSLARTLHQAEDPYRPVTQYATSDAGSIRSMSTRKGPEGSIYSHRTSRQPSIAPPLKSPGPYSPRQNSFPKSPVIAPEPIHTRPEQAQIETASPPRSPPGRKDSNTLSPIGFEPNGTAGDFALQPLPPTAQVDRKLYSPTQPSPADSGVEVTFPENPFEKAENQQAPSPVEPSNNGVGFSSSPASRRGSSRTSTSSATSRVMSPTQPVSRGPPVLPAAPIVEEPINFYDFDFAQMPEEPRNTRDSRNLDVEEPRGRNMQRQSHLYEQQQNGGPGALGVPQQDNRRLSVGFRPLPPDEIMDSEDPEYRANRIRSFYKEYFDETKPENMPPLPAMPQQHQQQYQQQQQQQRQQQYPQQPNNGAGYYEDYDESYLQDAPYFDPVSNSFVMPYAQPVSRRAMTPPPSGQRFPGPRGPPRGPGMRNPGPRGPPRPGSSASNNTGPRPGSSASGAYGRPRAGSTMSGGRFGGQPRKPMPPPTDLVTLPTPSKLRDDSFAIFNAADFAPPETFADRVRGRSQSPVGERRPYKLNVPVHSPLVNAFEELPALPSPHLLRKSTTFTALDFAPPRKFADSDTRSETGSIRSNRSGLSQAQANAIRSGAGRVSRLPGDTIFTQNAMASTLKPQWGMRD